MQKKRGVNLIHGRCNRTFEQENQLMAVACYNTIKTTFNTYALDSDIYSQKNFLNKVGAKTNHSLVKNNLRKDIGNVVHGEANNKNTSIQFFRADKTEKSENLQALYGRINENHANYAPILAAFLEFSASVLQHKTNDADALNNISANFLKKLLKIVPAEKKEKAKSCLSVLTESSTQVINSIQLDGDKIKKFMNNYFNSIEILAELILGSPADDDIKELKNIILCSTTLAGLFLTYEKRSQSNKNAIAVKQSLFGLAYGLGAILGVVVTIGLGPFISPLASIAIGAVLGFALTKFLDHRAEKYLEHAKEDINNSLKKVTKQKKRLLGIDEVDYPTKEENSFREIAKGTLPKPLAKQKNSMEIEGCDNHALQQNTAGIKAKINGIQAQLLELNSKELTPEIKENIKELFNILDPSHTITNELYALLHMATNCALRPDNLKNRFSELMKSLIPSSLDADDKKFIVSASLLLVLNLRGIDVVALRKSDDLLFVIFDVLVDVVGMGTTMLINPFLALLPQAATYAIDFGASLLTGLVPAGLGILAYFAIIAWSIAKDKKGIHLPNDSIIEEVRNYKKTQEQEMEETLQLAKILKITSLHPNNSITHIKEPLDKLNDENPNKIIAFKVTGRQGEENYRFKYVVVDSLSEIPDGYLYYPLLDNDIENLEAQLAELKKELISIDKRREEIQSKKPKVISIAEQSKIQSRSIVEHRPLLKAV